jgi:hypothetical protein
MFAISWASGGSVLTERRDSAFAAQALAKSHSRDPTRLKICDLLTGDSLTIDDLRSRAEFELRPQREARTALPLLSHNPSAIASKGGEPPRPPQCVYLD